MLRYAEIHDAALKWEKRPGLTPDPFVFFCSVAYSRRATGRNTTAPTGFFKSHTLPRWTSTPGPRRSRMASRAAAFSHRNQSEAVPIFGNRTSTSTGGFSSNIFPTAVRTVLVSDTNEVLMSDPHSP